MRVVNSVKLPFVNPKMMGEMIRQQIRKTLYNHHESTKVELAQKTGISFPTISKAVEEMKEQGEILLTGLGESSGGRRPQKYKLNPSHMLGLAVYLEKDHSTYTLLNYIGEVIVKEPQQGVLQDGPEALNKQIAAWLERYPNIRALTFGVPGAVNNGRVFHIPDYEKFKDFDFKAFYQERYSIQVQVENDMNATVLGYHDSLGNDRSLSLVYLYLGINGPGAGIIVNGDLVRGKTFFSGEVSFIPIYDTRNFDQAVKERSVKQEDYQNHPKLIDAMGRLVAVFVATLNPHKIIFCSTDMTEHDLSNIMIQSALYVPKENLPTLIVRDWEADYSYGLHQLTIRNMLGIGID